jgi:hypothetical protein
MSARTYYMDDASIALPGGFIDRSSNILEWPLAGGDKLALVVQRERLPPGGVVPAAAPHSHSHGPHGSEERAPHAVAGGDGGASDGHAFDRYVADQTRVYPTQFSGFTLERDEAAVGGAAFEMRRKVFRWRYEQDVLYHNQVFVLLGSDVLVMTGSAKARHRDAVDEVVDGAVAALRMRGPEDRL